MLICEYCDHRFSTIGNLNLHQRTAKYCLEKQLKQSSDEFKCLTCEKSFTRKDNLEKHQETCKIKNNKIDNAAKETLELKFSMKENETLKKNHEKSMNEVNKLVEELKNTIKEKDIYIQTLLKEKDTYIQTLLDKTLNQKNTTINTNNTNFISNNITVKNRLDLSKENLVPFADKYTKEYFNQGVKGIFEWIKPIIRDNDGNPLMFCSDNSRKVMTYFDTKGNKVRDKRYICITG